LRSFLAAFALATLMILHSPAEAETAREMVSKCGQTFAAAAVDGEAVSIPRTDSAGWCWGAFEVIQRIVVYADESNLRFFRVCPPPDSTRLQIIGTFLDFAKRHPEQMNREFTDVALDSLVEAYPCR
jgi:hypothetical protein